jgi:hypothetical protein
MRERRRFGNVSVWIRVQENESLREEKIPKIVAVSFRV